VGVTRDETELGKGEEDVAQRSLRAVEAPGPLAYAHGTSAAGESSQDPRGLVHGRDGTQGRRTVCHTRTGDGTSALRGQVPRVGRLGRAMELDPSETWSDEERRRAQWSRLAERLPELRRDNAFYRATLPKTASAVEDLPFTTKAELSEDQAEHPPFGTNLTYPLERYVRLHQTSGTTGRPLRFLDTASSWDWWRACWQPVYRAAGVT